MERGLTESHTEKMAQFDLADKNYVEEFLQRELIKKCSNIIKWKGVQTFRLA